MTCCARRALSVSPRTPWAAAALAAALAASPGPTRAATLTWQCGSATWTTASCWSPNGVPGSADEAQVPGRTTINAPQIIGGSVSLAALRVGLQLTPTTNPTAASLTVTDNASLSVAGVAQVGAAPHAYAALWLSKDSQLNLGSQPLELGWTQASDPLGTGLLSTETGGRVNGTVILRNGHVSVKGGSTIDTLLINGSPTRDGAAATADIRGTVGDLSVFHSTGTSIGSYRDAAPRIGVLTVGTDTGSSTVSFVGASSLGAAWLSYALVTVTPMATVMVDPTDRLRSLGTATLTLQRGASISAGGLELFGDTTVDRASLQAVNPAHWAGSAFVNSGTLTVLPGTSTVTAPSMRNDNTIRLQPGSQLALRGSTLLNRGTVQLGDQAQTADVAHEGLVNNGIVRGSGRLSSAAGTFEQGPSGAVVAVNNLKIESSFDGRNGGALVAEAAGRLFFYGDAQMRAGQVFDNGNTTGALVVFGRRLEIGAPGARGGFDAGTAALALEITSSWTLNLASPSDHDFLSTAGPILLGDGSLVLRSADSFVAGIGSSFQVLRSGRGIVGSFGSINASGLALAPGAVLDTSGLYTTGTLAVVAVPEPATWASLDLGLLLIGLRLQRGRQVAAFDLGTDAGRRRAVPGMQATAHSIPTLEPKELS